MPLRIAYPQQTPSGPLNQCEIYTSLYENSTVDAIMLRILLTSSLPVSLTLDRSFYSRFFPSLSQKNLSLITTSTCADKIEYSRLCVPIPLPCACSSRDSHSVTSNIFVIAFVLMTCFHTLTWSTSSYGLNLVLRRRFSILVCPLACYPS